LFLLAEMINKRARRAKNSFVPHGEANFSISSQPYFLPISVYLWLFSQAKSTLIDYSYLPWTLLPNSLSFLQELW